MMHRASMRFVGYNDRKTAAAALRPIYTAVNAEAARTDMDACADSEWARSTRTP
jgi:transposase-like protein